MEEITSIPFWLVYTLSHCGTFFAISTALMALGGAVAIIFGIIAGDSRDFDVAKKSFKTLWVFTPLFLIFGIFASICPSQEDFRAYIIIKCCNEVIKSDIAKSSQDAITSWLTNKVEEQFKTTQK